MRHYLDILCGTFMVRELKPNPKLGASWEGFALEEIIRHTHALPHECYFWRTHTG